MEQADRRVTLDCSFIVEGELTLWEIKMLCVCAKESISEKQGKCLAHFKGPEIRLQNTNRL